MDALKSYVEYGFAVSFALIVTGFVILLTFAVGSMLYALYKGATDKTWR